ncbi:hypothetical protein EDD85DRAFT_935757 [Armillaria nabsnona]|nr:hypothetical protein EDD85DRAFT_935757 [Armillaria nabsnona]
MARIYPPCSVSSRASVYTTSSISTEEITLHHREELYLVGRKFFRRPVSSLYFPLFVFSFSIRLMQPTWLWNRDHRYSVCRS